jgi:hypothetical protein
VDVPNHPYAQDLDLFGRASLFRWLGPAATAAGSARLAAWLLAPAEPGEIRARQVAVAELAPLADWREQVAAHGVLAGGGEDPGARRSSPGPRGRARSARRDAPARGRAGADRYDLGPDCAARHRRGGRGVLGLSAPRQHHLSFAMTKTIHLVVRARRRRAADAGAVRGAARGRDPAAFEAPWLVAVQERLTRRRRAAPACMRRLARILGFAELRSGAALLHFPIQALTLWDFHVLFALERWRRHVGGRVRDWFDALADLDALACLAGARHDNPAWAFPILATGRLPRRRAGASAHPGDRRVGNDVEIGPARHAPPRDRIQHVRQEHAAAGRRPQRRARAGRAVRLRVAARAADLRPPDEHPRAGLARAGALLLHGGAGASERRRRCRRAPARRPRLLYLLDEILQGTNSAERGIAVQAVARHLLDAGAIGMMTTHDLNLAGEEPLKSSGRLVHFTEIVDDHGAMRFDYRLRDGLATLPQRPPPDAAHRHKPHAAWGQAARMRAWHSAC